MATFRDLLSQVKQSIREVDPEGAEAQRDQAVFLDVREADEYAQGAIPGAVHIPRGYVELQIEGRVQDKSQPIVVYCAGGARSALAAKALGDLGYTDVVSMAGGFNKWKDEGRSWSAPRTLDADQRNRYQRHLLLPEVGEARAGVLLVPAPVQVPGCRRGHARHHRHGRGGRLEPAAPDPPQPRPHR